VRAHIRRARELRRWHRRHWRDAHSSIERHYGLGIMCGKTADCEKHNRASEPREAAADQGLEFLLVEN